VARASVSAAITTFEAADELPHAVGADPAYSESVYFNFVDAESGVAGLLRVGNRPRAGHGEVTVLMYLPGGAAAFRYARPALASPSFALEGLRVDFLEPLRRTRVQYAGEVHVLARGEDLEDPRRAFAASLVQELALDLRFEGVMPLVGWKQGTVEATLDAGGAFAPNHFEAICTVRGALQIGGRSLAVDGHGVRDHSWGPRTWQAPEYYRWLSGISAEGEGFVAWLMKAGEGVRAWGFVRAGGETVPLGAAKVRTEYGAPPQHYPLATVLELDAGGRGMRIRGTRRALVPLRHRSKEREAVARLSEMVLRYEGFGERDVHGIAEFQDLIVDGSFSGLAEA
jgi:hypothetical protein